MFMTGKLHSFFKETIEAMLILCLAVYIHDRKASFVFKETIEAMLILCLAVYIHDRKASFVFKETIEAMLILCLAVYIIYSEHFNFRIP